MSTFDLLPGTDFSSRENPFPKSPGFSEPLLSIQIKKAPLRFSGEGPSLWPFRMLRYRFRIVYRSVYTPDDETVAPLWTVISLSAGDFHPFT